MGLKCAADFGRGGATHYLDEVRITSSCPSHIHSVALAADGRAFSWGCGSDGRTGLAALMRGPRGAKRTLKCYVSTPSVVEALEGNRVMHLTSGRYWSLAVVEPGRHAERDTERDTERERQSGRLSQQSQPPNLTMTESDRVREREREPMCS